MDVVAVFGPTAVGKTDVLVELAELLRARGEDPLAISADALQVYRGLGTLTGVASAEQQRMLEHRLVEFVPVSREFSVGEYMPLAHAEVDAALRDRRRPLVSGGTGLYLRAALADLTLQPPPPPDLRARLEAQVARRGPRALHAELAEREPALAATIEPTDRTRVVRALERLETSPQATLPAGPESELWTPSWRRPTRLFALVLEREELYRRIDARVDAIVAAGALDEVGRADAAGAARTARKALGFEELLRGDVEAMKRRTRNYAKRQLTWLRKLAGVTTVDLTGRTPADAAAEIERSLDD